MNWHGMMAHPAFKSYGAFKGALSTWSGQEALSTPLRLTAGAGAGVVAVGALRCHTRLDSTCQNMGYRLGTDRCL